MFAELANDLSSPLVHAPFLFLIFKGMHKLKPSKVIFNYLSYIPLIWLYLCSLTYPSVMLVKPLEDPYPTITLESEQWENTDAIVILACYYFEDEKLPFVSRWPSCSLQRNLQASLMYMRKPKHIYLAGGILGSENKQSQAYHNRFFLEKLGVNPNDITIIPKGYNTQTEVAALSNLLQGKTISLVTSASHIPRALGYFERYDINVLPIPVEHLSRKNVKFTLTLPNAQSLYRSERAIHEYLGLIYQKLIL